MLHIDMSNAYYLPQEDMTGTEDFLVLASDLICVLSPTTNWRLAADHQYLKNHTFSGLLHLWEVENAPTFLIGAFLGVCCPVETFSGWKVLAPHTPTKAQLSK